MECGFIKILIISIIICIPLLCGCENNREDVIISNEIRDYTYSQKLDKCGITELYEYSITDNLKDIVEKSEYFIDKEQVSNYSINIIDNYEYIAYMYDISLEEYYTKNMKLSKDEFYEKCYNEGVYDVKYIYALGAIANKENISVSKEEYDKYLEENEYDSNLSNTDKDRVIFQIVESKIKKIFMEEHK